MSYTEWVGQLLQDIGKEFELLLAESALADDGYWGMLRKYAVDKAQLTELVANDAGLTKTQAGAALDSILSGIMNTLAGGDQVALLGFGTFSIKVRAARVGRNPKTGEPINIAEAKIPSFKAGKGFKDAVADAKEETAAETV